MGSNGLSKAAMTLGIAKQSFGWSQIKCGGLNTESYSGQKAP